MNDDELEALAAASEGEFRRRRRVMQDFRYDEIQQAFWDTTTSTLLAAKSVDGAIARDDWPTRPNAQGEERPYPPSQAINDIDTGLTVEGATWWPGEPQFILNRVVNDRGALRVPGAVCYNQYVAPELAPPNGVDPTPWIEHVKHIYPDPVEHEHFFDFCAHMIQRADEKVNHGIVMAGAMGIGKDTALLPVRAGVGEWNAAEVGPDAITSQYNGYVKSVLLVINEVRPQDEEHKASNFYNLLKPLLAAPPEMLPMTVKYANTIYVRNLCHVVLTTNDPLTMYIPPEDRRLFVMTSPVPDPKLGGKLNADYFDAMHKFFRDGGTNAVIRWLAERDMSQFNPTAPPRMTAGKRAIINSADQVRRTMVDDLLDEYAERTGAQEVIFHRDLSEFVRHTNLFDDVQAVVKLLNAKNFHFKMNDRGYDMVRNPDAPEWRKGKFRTRVAFVRREIPEAKQVEVIRAELEKRG